MQSQYREQWQFQWALAHSKCFDASTARDPNAWCIVNRLTRSRLSSDLGYLQKKGYPDRDKDRAWKLELDSPGVIVWKITNISTQCILEQVTLGNAWPALRCDKKSLSGGRGQKWILRYICPTISGLISTGANMRELRAIALHCSIHLTL